jgi:cytochrome P450
MKRRNLPPGDKTISPLGIAPRFARDPFGFLTDQFRRYGDVVLIPGPFYRPNFLINQPDLTQQILVTQADKFQKPPILKRPFTSTFGNGLFFSEGDLWRRQRKLMQPVFHHQYIQAYGQEMTQRTLERLSTWPDGEPVDIAAEMHALTLTVVVDAIFHSDITAETTRFTQAITTVGEVLNLQITRPWLAIMPDKAPIPIMKRKRQAVAELDQIIYSLIAQRRAAPVGQGDLLSLMLASKDEETSEPMSDLQLHDEVLTLFIAGHETTALTLTWAFILLSQNPEVEARLQAEVDEVLADNPPSATDLPQLPYTDQVIKETLRLYPPAWGILREALEPVKIDNLALERGDIVWLTPYLIQRDPRYFDQPERFWPERFSADENGQPLERRIPKYAYYPFGGGPRICLGNGFAMLEARLLLATIVQRYQLRLRPDHQVKVKVGPTLSLDGPVPMQIIQREVSG